MRNNHFPIYRISLKPCCSPPPPHHHFDNEVEVKEEVTRSALRLEHQRKISLTGDAQGAVLFDGSQDVILKIIVKRADRADKDSNGNVITDTYVKKRDLNQKLSLIETVLYATKNAVNDALSSDTANYSLATQSDIDAMFESEEI